jgi:hypothetical protein
VSTAVASGEKICMELEIFRSDELTDWMEWSPSCTYNEQVAEK